MYVDILGLLEILLIGAETAGAVIEVIDAIQEAIDQFSIINEPDYADMTLEEKTETLKRCTRIVANLGLDLSCYPLGYTTTILFDLEGNPLP